MNEQESLSLLHETIDSMEWVAGEKPETKRAMLFTVGLLFVTRNAARLAELLGIDIYTAAVWYYRLRACDVVSDQGMRIEWDNEEHGDICVLLDAMVAMGMATRTGAGAYAHCIQWDLRPVRRNMWVQGLTCPRCQTPQVVWRMRTKTSAATTRQHPCIGCKLWITEPVPNPLIGIGHELPKLQIGIPARIDELGQLCSPRAH